MLNFPNLIVISDDRLTELCRQIAWAAITNLDTTVGFNPISLGYISLGKPGSYDVDVPGLAQRREKIESTAIGLKRVFYRTLASDQETGPIAAEQFLRRQIMFRDRWVKEIRQRFIEVRINQNMVDQELTRRLATAETIKFFSEVAHHAEHMAHRKCGVDFLRRSIPCQRPWQSPRGTSGHAHRLRLVRQVYGSSRKLEQGRCSRRGQRHGQECAVRHDGSSAGAYIDNQVAIQMQDVQMAKNTSQTLNQASRLRDLRTMNNPQLSSSQRWDIVWKNANESRQTQQAIQSQIEQGSSKATALGNVGKFLSNPVTQGALGFLSVYFWRQSLIETSNSYVAKMNL